MNGELDESIDNKIIISYQMFNKENCCDIISKMQSRCQLENSLASGTC